MCLNRNRGNGERAKLSVSMWALHPTPAETGNIFGTGLPI
ncbi:hypothetical protein CFter6_1887 [Collimonas fungivorans]|uniref:Uncharacterized protein n=1 Tax=Collimonas fungivorans TaxID=158899 RepID=A0A127P9U0_9BURK|nr:hypothetical protein CFter6_1887 [Collimonas fungivorans]